MRITVCMKPLYENAAVEIGERGPVKAAGATLGFSPADIAALKKAKQIAEACDGEVTVVCAGGSEIDAVDLKRELFARGADACLFVADDALTGADAHALACVLADALAQDELPDLILCGECSTDWQAHQVPAQLAELLHMAFINNAADVECTSWCVRAVRLLDDEQERLSTTFPAVIALRAEKGQVEPVGMGAMVKALRKVDLATVVPVEEGTLAANSVAWDVKPEIASMATSRQMFPYLQMLAMIRSSDLTKHDHIVADGSREQSRDRLVSYLVSKGA